MGNLLHGPIRCWERLSCKKHECKAYKSDDLRCWLIPHAGCFDGSVRVLDRLASECTSCPVYVANRQRSAGKRLSDKAMIDTVDAIVNESKEMVSRIESLTGESRSKSAQVTLLSEVGRALQSTMDIDELLLVVLTAVTAGDGLGFNRAFLLLVDETGTAVRCRMAVGPSRPEEAETIWRAMENEARTLGEILGRLSTEEKRRSDGIMNLGQRLAFSLEDKTSLVARVINEAASRMVDNARDVPGASEIAAVLGSDHFLVVPLVAEGTKLGAIVVDNFVTGRRITSEDVRLLETFASQAALALLNAALHEKLRQRVEQLERAHEELSRNQLQLLRAERLVAAGGLAAAFIHDLKAPLVSIGIMAKATASGLAEGDPTRERLEQIAKETTKVEEYLRHVALSAGKGAKDTIAIDVADVIHDTVDVMRGVMQRAGVEVGVDLNHGAARVCVNRVELRQVMLNLIYNSVEAMPDGGRIRVATGYEDGMLSITVEDSGKGIPADLRSRVFSPFFTTKSHGMGLGLVIARLIIGSYGGRIHLESTEGAGTCFRIVLPIARRSDEAGPTIPQ